MKVGAHIIVKGVVQGVGFRWFVEREANKLGLLGTVRNLFNGDVEVNVEGERGLIEEFISALKVGNRFSSVSGLQIDWLDFKNKYKNFQIQF